ncbi:MAG: S9 family peptidase [Rhodothalassiaceae bacterium]
MSIRGVGALGVCALLLWGCGQAAEAPKQEAQAAESVPTYSADQFYQTITYGIAASSEHAFAPDGQYVLIHSDKTGIFNVYAMPVDGGAAEQLTQSTDHATFAVSYFPDGDRFLYTFDQGGNELNQIYVGGIDGDPVNLTPGENTKAGFAGWHEGDQAFFLTTNERDPAAFDLYRYDAQQYDRALVYENTEADAIAAVSPNGRYVALIRANTSADNNILLADLQSDAAPQLITEHEGDIDHRVYGFSPSGDALIYGTDEHGEFTEAWSYDLETGETAKSYSADWDVVFVDHSPSGRYTVYGVNADAQTQVTIVENSTDTPVQMPQGIPDGQLSGIRFSPDERRMAVMVRSDTSPADLFIVDLSAPEAERLTSALNADIAEEHLVTASVARFESYDGLDIPGILYKPHQASADTPVPALVWVHGGPGGQSRKGYNPTIQHLVNHGYAVYAINNRGSSGYGKTFYHMDDKRHGEADLADVVASKDFLAGKDWIDGERIGIIGGSYGGYMVTAALAFEPEVFDVGVDIFGVTNWVRTLKSIPPWWEAFKKSLYDEMGDPATDEERLRRISSLFHADQIKKPMLVIQGANDPRVLQVESDELVEAVRANGVPVEYIVFPDEGHGFRSRKNRITASEAYVEFLDTYLKQQKTAQAQ